MSTTEKPYGAIETAKFSYNFLSDNFEHFKKLLIPLLPVLFLSTLISGMLEKGKHADNPTILIVLAIAFGIAAFLYTTAFVISWHRAVVLGPSESNKVNPLKMTKSEISFLLTGFIIFFGMLAAGLVAGLILGLLSSIFFPLAVIGGIALIIAAFIYTARLYLFFPAKAAGKDITLRQAFEMGRGVAGNIIGSLFVGALPIAIAAGLTVAVVGLITIYIIGVPESMGQRFTFSLIITPFQLFFNMAGAAIGVGILSRYYIWASEHNKS